MHGGVIPALHPAIELVIFIVVDDQMHKTAGIQQTSEVEHK
jgi:hypothetical protein